MTDDPFEYAPFTLGEGLSPPARDALRGLMRPRTWAAGEWLLRAGDQARWCFLVTHGLVRELYVGEDGTEHTRVFLAEGQLTGSLLDLLSGEPSVTWIEALEPTRGLAWSYAEFNDACYRLPELHVLARRAAEVLAVRKTRREYEMLALSARERYQRWLAEHPRLDARVRRKDLASYLGVTPETVSRMRRSR